MRTRYMPRPQAFALNCKRMDWLHAADLSFLPVEVYAIKAPCGKPQTLYTPHRKCKVCGSLEDASGPCLRCDENLI